MQYYSCAENEYSWKIITEISYRIQIQIEDNNIIAVIYLINFFMLIYLCPLLLSEGSICFGGCKLKVVWKWPFYQEVT